VTDIEAVATSDDMIRVQLATPDLVRQLADLFAVDPSLHNTFTTLVVMKSHGLDPKNDVYTKQQYKTRSAACLKRLDASQRLTEALTVTLDVDEAHDLVVAVQDARADLDDQAATLEANRLYAQGFDVNADVEWGARAVEDRG
jgi:hypothetical protein